MSYKVTIILILNPEKKITVEFVFNTPCGHKYKSPQQILANQAQEHI